MSEVNGIYFTSEATVSIINTKMTLNSRKESGMIFKI